MSFNSYKQQSHSAIIHPNEYELNRAPRQFCDYMNEQCTRFAEICHIYLEGMTLDDVCYMKPKDFINLVPHDQYRHKLLMTIMVRRYLCRHNECGFHDCGDTYTDSDSCSEKTEYKCNKCSHVCTNRKCTHKCSDYIKIKKR